MAKTGSEIVAAAQEKLMERGGQRLTLTLGPDDAKAWRALVKRYGNARGAKMQAFRDAVSSALHVEITDDALIAALTRRLKGRGK